MKGWVDLGVGYIPVLRQFTSLQTVTHPSSNHLIVTQLWAHNLTIVNSKYDTPPLDNKAIYLLSTYIFKDNWKNLNVIFIYLFFSLIG